MSIKTLSKKMLAIVAAGAMTMGLAMPTLVFAAEGDTPSEVKEAYISKTFNTAVGKNETFSFQAKQVTGDTAEVTIPDINFTDSETGSNTKRAEVKFPNWTDAGKYEYTVTETKAARNKAIKSKVKTAVKKVETAVAEKNVEAAKAALHTAIVEISKAGSKGVYHKKTVSRKIARLSKAVDSIA